MRAREGRGERETGKGAGEKGMGAWARSCSQRPRCVTGKGAMSCE